MTDRLFVDASALVAILAVEPGWEEFATAITSARTCFTSPMTILETVMVLSTATGRTPRSVERTVGSFLVSQGIKIVAIDAAAASVAVAAFERFGKGRHPARLNLGDCVSYACAKEHGATLLYKGEDFRLTDLG